MTKEHLLCCERYFLSVFFNTNLTYIFTFRDTWLILHRKSYILGCLQDPTFMNLDSMNLKEIDSGNEDDFPFMNNLY